MHTVAADQEPVMLPQSDGRIVETRKILETDGAVEEGGEGAASGDVILGQPFQAAFAQAVGAGITDMNHMAEPSRQDYRREGAAHAAEQGVDPALAMDPVVGGFER